MVRHEHHRLQRAVGSLPQKRDAVPVDKLQLEAVEHARVQATQQRDELVERAAVGVGVVQVTYGRTAQQFLEARDRGVVAARVGGRQGGWERARA